MNATLPFLIIALATGPVPPPASVWNAEGAAAQVGLVAELGLLAPLAHQVQFSRAGTLIDYVGEGGQDVLFPVARLAADLTLAGHHDLTLVYQPLQLDTQVVPRRDWSVDGATFAAGRAIDVRYGFSFWRLLYHYSFYGRGRSELGVGAGLQLRNAVIDFTDVAAGVRRSQRNVGPVPLLAVRGRVHLADRLFLAGEAAGMWAPLKVLNGSNTDVNGAIADADESWHAKS